MIVASYRVGIHDVDNEEQKRVAEDTIADVDASAAGWQSW